MYVIGNLSRLEYLDDAIVTDAQRVQSESHKSIYTQNEHGTNMQFVEKFTGGPAQFLNLFRYDRPKRSRASTKTKGDYRRSRAAAHSANVVSDSSSQS